MAVAAGADFGLISILVGFMTFGAEAGVDPRRPTIPATRRNSRRADSIYHPLARLTI